MFFVIFFNQGGFSTPHPPLNSSPDYSLIKALTSTLAKCLSNSYQVPIKTKKEGKQTVNNIAILLLSLSFKVVLYVTYVTRRSRPLVLIYGVCRLLCFQCNRKQFLSSPVFLEMVSLVHSNKQLWAFTLKSHRQAQRIRGLKLG